MSQSLCCWLRFLRWDVQISKEAQEYMIEEYKHLRQRDCTGAGKSSWRITVRQLESMIRLSESMARMHCQEEVSHVRCLGLLMPSLSVQPSYALSVRVHGTHALSGRGEPRTLPRFAYALSVSTTILCPLCPSPWHACTVRKRWATYAASVCLCPLCQYNHLMPSLSESMARMHCQEEVSHVRCLSLLMPSLSVHGTHALSGRGEPRTLPWFAYALSVSTTILCPLRQYSHLMPSLSVQPSYALSVSTTILCPLCQSMARMRCQEEVSHVRCLGLLMPSLSAQPSYALSVSTTILCPLCQYNHLMPSLSVHGTHALSGRGEPRTLPRFAYALCQYNHLMPSPSVQPSYALSVSTTILCPLCQYNHLMPSLSVQPSYALSVSTTILCPLCQYNHLMPSLSVHGTHALSGRGEPRTLPRFAYAACSGFGSVFPNKSHLQQGCATLSVSTTILCPLSVQPSYALSVSTTIWMIPVGAIFTDLVEQQFCVLLLIVLFFFSKTG